MTSRIPAAACLTVAALVTGPAACGSQEPRAPPVEGQLVEASRQLFGCLGRQEAAGIRQGWSDLEYYRAIREACTAETEAFTAANLRALPADAGLAARRVVLKRTRQALAGALVDAALAYERTVAYRADRVAE